MSSFTTMRRIITGAQTQTHSPTDPAVGMSPAERHAPSCGLRSPPCRWSDTRNIASAVPALPPYPFVDRFAFLPRKKRRIEIFRRPSGDGPPRTGPARLPGGNSLHRKIHLSAPKKALSRILWPKSRQSACEPSGTAQKSGHQLNGTRSGNAANRFNRPTERLRIRRHTGTDSRGAVEVREVPITISPDQRRSSEGPGDDRC